MFIPLAGENVLCLSNTIALYRENDKTIILRRDGTKETTPFTPQTLKKRGEALWNDTVLDTHAACVLAQGTADSSVS